MGAFGNAVYAIFKRPFIVFCFGLFMAAFFVVIYFFYPIILIGLSTVGTGNIIESIIYFFQFLLASVLNVKVLTYALVFLAGVSIILGFVFSGYFYIIHNALDGRHKQRGEFMSGVRKYFFRMLTVTFRALLASCMFIAFMMVASVPALMITHSFNAGKSELFAAAIFVDILTICVLFFGCMFFRIYIFFWYPAAFSFERKSFSIGKRVADMYFWNIVGKFIVFDILFVTFQSISTYLYFSFTKQGNLDFKTNVTMLGIDWLFKTVFFSCFSTYVFSALKMFKGNIKE